MGRVRRSNCRLCMKPTNRGESTIINNLPKTFAHMLEEMSGIRFSQTDGLQISVCLRCRDFLQAMEHHSQYPMSNKISGAGKKKVRRLMDKGFSAAEAIEKVLAEKRAKTLLAGAVTPAQSGNIDLPFIQSLANNQSGLGDRRRMSGAQRKKVQILIAGGVDRDSARELVLAASQVTAAGPNMAAPGQMDQQMQKRTNQRRRLPNDASQNGGNARRGSPQKPVASRTLVSKSSSQRLGTQRLSATKGLAQKALLLKKAAIRSGNANAIGQRASNTKLNAQRTASGTQRPTGSAQRAPNNNNAQRGSGNNNQRVQSGNQRAASGSRRAPTTQRGMAKPAPQRAQSGSKRAPAPTAAPTQKNVTAAPTQQKRADNNARGGGRNVGPEKRTDSNSRRNERPAPYDNNNRGGGNNRQQQRDRRNVDKIQQNPLDVGIIPINYPQSHLDDMKLDALKEAITNEILKIPSGGPSVRFLGTTYQDGWLKLTCADKLSFDWLSVLVSRWERAGLRLVDGNSLPQPGVLTFYLSGDFRSPDEILNILERQNNSLNTGLWRVLNRKTDNNGQSITVCVDELSFQALRNRDFTVFLGLGMIELKPQQSPNVGQGQSFNNNNGQQNAPMGNNNYNNRSNYDMGKNPSQNFSNNSGHMGGGGSGGGSGGMGNNNNSGGGGGGGSYYRQGYQTSRFQSQRSW